MAGSLLRLLLALAVGYSALGAASSYWQVVEAQRLTTDPLNSRIAPAAARQAPRGTIFDRSGNVLAHNIKGPNGEPLREYPYFVRRLLVGYRSGIFGRRDSSGPTTRSSPLVAQAW